MRRMSSHCPAPGDPVPERRVRRLNLRSTTPNEDRDGIEDPGRVIDSRKISRLRDLPNRDLRGDPYPYELALSNLANACPFVAFTASVLKPPSTVRW
jgi:hypothetical protein